MGEKGGALKAIGKFLGDAHAPAEAAAAGMLFLSVVSLLLPSQLALLPATLPLIISGMAAIGAVASHFELKQRKLELGEALKVNEPEALQKAEERAFGASVARTTFGLAAFMFLTLAIVSAWSRVPLKTMTRYEQTSGERLPTMAISSQRTNGIGPKNSGPLVLKL